MKRIFLLAALFAASVFTPKTIAQNLTLPDATNPKCWIGQRVGLTDVEIRWNAPGVKGREGKIWDTPIAHFGFTDIGFGTAKSSPWRAGANECTTISFSTDVKIEGKTLAAGKYGFFIALGADECELIFSKDNGAWGTYFYKPENDALRVKVRQQKDLPTSRERLAFTFSEPTETGILAALEWEKWRIPLKIEVDLNSTVVASLQKEMDSGKWWDVPSLQAAANWCATHDVNLDQALVWITNATDPTKGGNESFANLATKSDLQRKLGQSAEADKTMAAAVEKGSVLELHGYGRQLLGNKKTAEALVVFQKNYDKHGGEWPSNVGLARGLSASGDLKKALEHAKKALAQAPDDVNKKSLEAMVKTLGEGKALMQ